MSAVESSTLDMQTMFRVTPEAPKSLLNVSEILREKLSEIVSILPEQTINILKRIAKDSRDAIADMSGAVVNKKASEFMIDAFGKPVEDPDGEYDFESVVTAYEKLAGKVVSANDYVKATAVEAKRQIVEHQDFLLNMIRNFLQLELDRLKVKEEKQEKAAGKLNNAVYAQTEMSEVKERAKDSSQVLLEAKEDNAEKRVGLKNVIAEIIHKMSSVTRNLGTAERLVYSAS